MGTFERYRIVVLLGGRWYKLYYSWHQCDGPTWAEDFEIELTSGLWRDLIGVRSSACSSPDGDTWQAQVEGV